MLAKKSKSGLRFGLILAFIDVLLFGCVSPPATQPIKYSPPTVTEFSTSKTPNIGEPTFTSEVVKRPTSTLQPTNTITLSPPVTFTLSPTQTATVMPTLRIGSTKVSPVDEMTLVYLPEGNFQMGLTENQAESVVE